STEFSWSKFFGGEDKKEEQEPVTAAVPPPLPEPKPQPVPKSTVAKAKPAPKPVQVAAPDANEPRAYASPRDSQKTAAPSSSMPGGQPIVNSGGFSSVN